MYVKSKGNQETLEILLFKKWAKYKLVRTKSNLDVIYDSKRDDVTCYVFTNSVLKKK